MVLEFRGVRDTEGDADKVTGDKLILHAEGILIPSHEGLEIGAADCQGERAEVFGLLVLCSRGRMQFQGRASTVLEIHLECKLSTIIVKRGGHVGGHPIVPINPRVHEDLPLGAAICAVHLIYRVHRQHAGKHTSLSLDTDSVLAWRSHWKAQGGHGANDRQVFFTRS